MSNTWLRNYIAPLFVFLLADIIPLSEAFQNQGPLWFESSLSTPVSFGHFRGQRINDTRFRIDQQKLLPYHSDIERLV